MAWLTATTDNFNRSNETMDGGNSGWYKLTSMMSYALSVVSQRAKDALSPLWGIAGSYRDVFTRNDQRATIGFVKDANTWGGIGCRVSNAGANGYYLHSYFGTTTNLIYRRVSGANTLIASYSAPVVGSAENLRFQCIGSVISFWTDPARNGTYTERISATDSSIETGAGVLLWLQNTSSFNDRFDDLVCEEYLTLPAPVLSGAPDNLKNMLTWSAVAGADTYNLYWSIVPGVTKATGTRIADVTSPYEHTGLTNGVTYYYVVTAYDTVTDLESAESVEASATPAGPPAPSVRPVTVRSYWKRFMSRNPNYKGRLMEIYEGQVGMAEGEFTRTWVGKLTNVTTQRGEFTFESTDLLRDLSTIDVPPKLDIKLAADLSNVEAGQITLTSVEGLGSGAGYIRIKDEIIGYATINVTTKALQTLTRGAFGTVADEYKARDKVQAVRYYAPANPWDILLEMLWVDAGIADSDIDLDAFALAKRTPGNDKLFRAVLSEPEKLDKLFFEITDILDAKAWVGEDLRITIRRNVQNAPGRAYYRMTDGANIVDNSASVDFNEKSRLTRMLIYWHKSVLGKKDDPAAFDRLDIAVDADAEASYGDVVEKKVFCRWIDPITNEEDSAETYVKNLGMRQVRRSRDAQPLIALSLSLRDLGIKTGDHVRLDTDELVKFNGDPITNEIFQVVKRELQDDFSLKVSLLRVSTRRLALIAPNGYPNYRDATDAQKEFGFITLDTGLMENEDQGYYIW